MKKKLSSTILLAALLLASCHPEADINIAPTPIPFNITIEGDNTRVTTDAAFKSTFDNGDAIGLYVVKYSGGIATLLSSGNYVDNAKLTYNGTSWSGDVYYAPSTDTDVYTFYAYYPYNPNLTDAGDIPVDALNNPADHLTARHTNVARGETVSLSFEHILTLVQVDFDATQCYISPDLAVTLQGCRPTATHELGVVSPTGAIAPIPMTRMTGTNTFRAMVPPQTIAAGTHMFLIENDDRFQSQALATALTLSKGQAEVFPMITNKDYAPLITNDIFRAYCLTTFDTNPKDGKLSYTEVMAVTVINVANKGITTLAGIEHFKSLQTLNCYNNQLTELNLSALTALQYLDCSRNQLRELNLSALTALQDLYCSSNQLRELNLSALTALQTLYCSSNQLRELNLSALTALQYLDCYDNRLTELNLSALTALQTLSCSSNRLTELNLSALTALQTLRCYNNSFNELDVTANTALRTLYCGIWGNPFTVWVQSTITLGTGAGQLNVRATYTDGNDTSYTPITQRDTPVDGVTVRNKQP